MLVSLQYARAIAALAVVFVHLTDFAVFEPLHLPVVGGFGVDVFFIISGFIMWTTAAEMKPGRFVVRRLIRIVPAYWIFTTLLVVIALAAHSLTPDVTLDARSLLGSYLFIPYYNAGGGIQPLLLQGWTLNFEMWFYAVFAAALFLPGRQLRFCAVCGVLVVCSVAGALLGPQDAVLRTYTDPTLIEFCLGMGLAAVGRRQWLGGWLAGAVVALGLGALIVADANASIGWPRFIWLGLPALVFVAGLLGLEAPIARRRAAWLVAIGNASYSLYLSHPFVLKAMAVIAGAVVARLPGVPTVVAAVAFGLAGMVAAVGFAWLAFRFVEDPITRGLNARLLRKPAPPIATAESLPAG